MHVHSYMHSYILVGRTSKTQLKNQSLPLFWLWADHHSFLLELILAMESGAALPWQLQPSSEYLSIS